MSDYKKCPKCGEWGGSFHRCKPVWFVRTEDDDSESKVYANDAEEAAEKFIDENFSNLDYPKYLTVIVVNPERTEQHTVEIEVEPVPSFHCSITASKTIEKEAKQP
jgi:hypothetical protein